MFLIPDDFVTFREDSSFFYKVHSDSFKVENTLICGKRIGGSISSGNTLQERLESLSYRGEEFIKDISDFLIIYGSSFFGFQLLN